MQATPSLAGELGVLGRDDALEDDRQLVLVLETPELVPAESRLVALHFRHHLAPAADDKALGDVALAPAVHRGIDGEAKGLVARRRARGARNRRPRHRRRAHRAERCGGHRARPRPWLRARAGRPSSRTAARRRRAAALATAAVPPGSRFSIEPTGASTTGSRVFLPNSVRRRVDRRHVAQHARAEGE